MNIDNNYLWDKTGEPDPEVQQLEEILGTLRYQPRPLEIPSGLRVGRERSFFRGAAPRLAIAATIAMLLVGLGLWFAMQRLQQKRRQEVVRIPNTQQVQPNPAAATEGKETSSVAISSPRPEEKRTDVPGRQPHNQMLLARNSNRRRHAADQNQQLAARKKQSEQQEAENAKDQLVLALRVASAKFSFAQRKTQGLNQKDQVHNQHKIG